MVLLTEDGTRFSWFEYQVLMLSLAAAMCVALIATEITLNRFQSLPVLFPGMFTVRERRFQVFDLDITDGKSGKMIRKQAKNVIRMTILVVLSYLWQQCVLRAEQRVGKSFPFDQCNDGSDCFASEVHILTIFKRQYTSIDCSGDKTDFETRQVISCVRFMDPSASSWLMHLAIANSVAQLTFKCFELGVWVASKSRVVRHLIVALGVLSLIGVIVIFFLGFFSNFVTSWLSFVMTFSLPLWFAAVHSAGFAVKVVWEETEAKLQQSIEKNLNAAFEDIESVVRETGGGCESPESPTGRGSNRSSRGADQGGSMRSRTKRMLANMHDMLRVSPMGNRRNRLPLLPADKSADALSAPDSPAAEVPEGPGAAERTVRIDLQDQGDLDGVDEPPAREYQSSLSTV